MSESEIRKILDLTPNITPKERKIVQKTYPQVRGELLMDKRKEIELLTSYIAFIRLGLQIGA